MSIKFLGWLLPVALAGTLSANGGGPTVHIATDVVPSIAAYGGNGDNAWHSEKRKKRKPIVTPEPASLLLFGTGMLGLAAGIRRKKNRITK